MMSAFARWKTVGLIAGGLMTAFARFGTAGPLTPPGPPAETTKTLNEIEPRMMIDALPFRASVSGSYYLASDLIGSSGQDGVIVTAENAVIDLNGFNLIGPGAATTGAGVGIRVLAVQSAREAARFVIKDGGLFNWPGGGVSFESGDTSAAGELHHLKIARNGGPGVSMGGGLVDRCEIRANAGPALIFADGFESMNVTRSRLIRNTGNGIEAVGAAGGGAGLFIADTLIAGHSLNGILVALLLPAVQAVRATVVNNTGHGLLFETAPPAMTPDPARQLALLLPAVQLTDSTFSLNGGDAVSIQQGPGMILGHTDIVHVVMNGNGGAGFAIHHDAGVAGGSVRVADSRFTDNTRSGMSLSGTPAGKVNVEVAHADISSNGADGLSFDLTGTATAGFVIDDVIIGANDGSGVVHKMGGDMDSTLIMREVNCTGNLGHGVWTDYSSTGEHTASYTGLELTNNTMGGTRAHSSIPTETLSLNFDKIVWKNNGGAGLNLIIGGTGARSVSIVGGESSGNQVAGMQIKVDTGAALSLNFEEIKVTYNEGPGALVNVESASELALNFEEIKVTYNKGAGLKVMGAGTATGAITHSVATNNTAEGIHLATGRGFRVADNHMSANGTGLRVDSARNTIVRNSAGGNGGANPSNYVLNDGNDIGPIGPAAQATSPFANIEF